MRMSLNFVTSFALTILLYVAAVHTAMSQPAGGGSTVLFDGKNLDHWQGDGKAQFAVQDGAIVATGKKDPKDTAFLVSKDKYKDFELRAEFWVSNDANSGNHRVQHRGPCVRPGQHSPGGYPGTFNQRCQR